MNSRPSSLKSSHCTQLGQPGSLKSLKAQNLGSLSRLKRLKNDTQVHIYAYSQELQQQSMSHQSSSYTTLNLNLYSPRGTMAVRHSGILTPCVTTSSCLTSMISLQTSTLFHVRIPRVYVWR